MRACDSHSVQRALPTGRWWREVPFVLSRASEPAKPTQGRSPPAASTSSSEHDGELVVVDYKTDKDVTKDTAEAARTREHSGQAEIYARGARGSDRSSGPRGRVRLLQGGRRGATPQGQSR